MPTIATRRKAVKKTSPEAKIAKEIVEMVRDGMKNLPLDEQKDRVKGFCADLRASLQTASGTSASSRSVRHRMAGGARP